MAVGELTEHIRVQMNTMPLFGKSEGVRRYVRELATSLPSYGIKVKGSVDRSTTAKRMLSVPKVGFAVRHGYELLGIPPSRSADLLHYTDTFGPIRAPRPVVCTVHDMTFITHPDMHDPSLVQWLSGVTRRTWPRVERFIAVTATTKADMIQVGIDASQIDVIHHGVDHVLRHPPAPALPEGVVPGQYLLFLGNLEPRKNLRNLLIAFRSVEALLPKEAKLLIAGKVAWGTQPSREYEELSQRGRARLLGFVSDSMAVRLIQDCTAFVYPSSYEGFGLPPLEALLLGARVIAGDNPAAREVLGGYARLVDPTDIASLSQALLDAFENPGPVSPGREWASAFTWRRAAEQTAAVYNSVAREVR